VFVLWFVLPHWPLSLASARLVCFLCALVAGDRPRRCRREKERERKRDRQTDRKREKLCFLRTCDRGNFERLAMPPTSHRLLSCLFQAGLVRSGCGVQQRDCQMVDLLSRCFFDAVKRGRLPSAVRQMFQCMRLRARSSARSLAYIAQDWFQIQRRFLQVYDKLLGLCRLLQYCSAAADVARWFTSLTAAASVSRRFALWLGRWHHHWQRWHVHLKVVLSVRTASGCEEQRDLAVGQPSQHQQRLFFLTAHSSTPAREYKPKHYTREYREREKERRQSVREGERKKRRESCISTQFRLKKRLHDSQPVSARKGEGGREELSRLPST